MAGSTISMSTTSKLILVAAALASASVQSFANDAEPLRILQIRGLHFQYYRIDEAAKLLGADASKVSYSSYDERFKRGVTYFPASLSELSQFDLVVMNDLPISPRPTAVLDDSQVRIVRQYVEGGGALLVIGGHNAFAGGGYGESVLADLLPVAVKERFDVEWLQPPARLTGWGTKNSPVVIWRHRFNGLKPGAEVLLKAGDLPAIVVGQWQKGRVGAIGATCYGIPPKGTTPFWDWPEWPKVMAETIRRLVNQGGN